MIRRSATSPKEVNEFVNTWSVAGFYEEGIATAEMGWGTHERRLPEYAMQHTYGPCNQICLSQMGINTYVRSWVPMGEIIGMVVRHGEAFTISDHLTGVAGRRAHLPAHRALCLSANRCGHGFIARDEDAQTIRCRTASAS